MTEPKETKTERVFQERLRAVQTALKAPKGQRNTFGNYNYRNCEDILEAVKPLLAEHELTLLIGDNLVMIGDRYYVKAVAKVSDDLGGSADAAGFAREEEIKKGMDPSQITGAASSYARKYALNGLFLIDDTKDSDTTNEHDKAPAAPRPSVAVPSRSIGRPAMPVKQTVPPPDLLFMPTDDGPYDSLPLAKPEATPAERIHPLTVTKLGSALQLKGITDQNMRKDILSSIARQEYMTTSFLELDEEQAQSILKRISLAKQEDLIALIDPFAPIG